MHRHGQGRPLTRLDSYSSEHGTLAQPHMRIATIIAAVLFGGLVFLFMRSRPTPAERTERAAASAMLRQKVLSREFLSGAPVQGSGDIRCVVMDWHVGNGVASLVAFDDGSTSL